MEYNFYAIHLYINTAIQHLNANGELVDTTVNTYVNTVNGDRLVIHDATCFNGAGWFLYAGDTLVCCGDVATLHAESHSSDLDYNSFTFRYTEHRYATVM